MMKQGRRHENDDSGMALRPDGPPTASSRAVVVPGTQTGREHQLPSYRYSRQRRGYKLKARQARTEAEKCHPRASSQYSYQQSRDKPPGRQKSLPIPPRLARVRRPSAGLPKSRGAYKMFSHVLSERKTCTNKLPPFPVAIQSDSIATDCTRLKKFGREV
jgi:hypothetical protein